VEGPLWKGLCREGSLYGKGSIETSLYMGGALWKGLCGETSLYGKGFEARGALWGML